MSQQPKRRLQVRKTILSSELTPQPVLPARDDKAGNGGYLSQLRAFLVTVLSLSTAVVLAQVPAPEKHTHAQSEVQPTGMLDGVYVGLKMGTLLVGYGTHVQHDFITFFPDGSVMHTLPEEGLDGVDAASYRQTLDKWFVGRYRAYGDAVNVIWNNSPGERSSVKLDESVSDSPGSIYVHSCKCTGVRFSGTYLWGEGSLQFLSDGRFVDRGAVDAVITINIEHPRYGRGTYEVHNNTLYLNYADGHRIKKSFVAPAVEEKKGSFDWIAISQIFMYEKNYQATP